MELSENQINAIAYKVSLIVVDRLKKELSKREVPEMVTTAEAAKILGITPCRMRQIADKYPHIKRGDHKQGQLLFERKSLLQ